MTNAVIMNKMKSIKYAVLTILFGLGTLTSCIDDEYFTDCEEDGPAIDVDIPEEISKGYSMSLIATLDAGFGGDGDFPNELENYIDPEKFRVLFFDSKDQFLFESKSRWVKRLPDADNHSRWFVSVPFFSYGNELNEKYNWNWDYIKEQLTTNSFKIAILANRPDWDWAPKFDAQEGMTNSGEKWYDNSGPHWTVDDAASETNGTPKRIFDIHHSQFDPLYTNKSYPRDNKDGGRYGTDNFYTGEAFYQFVMEECDDANNGYDTHGIKIPMYNDDNKVPKLMMSSVSSWVDWGFQDKDKDKTYGTELRHFVHLSKDHPIPMYGIQRFDQVNPQEWKEGSTFYLNRGNDNPISLLRSVVKLDLRIPKYVGKEPEYVLMGYPNVFARCEPMNIWTPTNELWEDEHDSKGCSDWKKLIEYGPVSLESDYDHIDESEDEKVKRYQNRMAWFYGAWREDKNNIWSFNEHSDIAKAADLDGFIDGKIGGNSPYPQIFNSCIQRNNAVIVKGGNRQYPEYDDGTYYHYIVYTGERNINDPSQLTRMGYSGNGAAGQSTVIYWRVAINGKSYFVPITDFSNVTDADLEKMVVVNDKIWDGTDGTLNSGSQMSTYEKEVTKDKSESTVPKPWPLIRNHVYTLTLIPEGSIDTYKTWSPASLSTETISNLNADANWKTENSKTLSWDDLKDKGEGNNVEITWGEDWGATLSRNSDAGKFNSGSKINGNTSIKTGLGANRDADPDDRTTTLKVSDEKNIKSLTLYSYVNKNKIFSATVTATSAVSFDRNTETMIDASQADILGGVIWVINKNGNDKPASSNLIVKDYFCFTHNATYFKIELDHPLAEGDVISAKISEDGKGAYITSAEGYPSNKENLPFITKSNSTYTVKSGDIIEGESIIYLYRYTGSTTYFGDLAITRGAGTATYWSKVNNTEYGYNDTGMNSVSNTDPDVHKFDITGNTNEVSFTNSESGLQACYVAVVEVANADGTSGPWTLSAKPQDKELTAAGKVIEEFKGLKFRTNNSIVIHDAKDPNNRRLRLSYTGGDNVTRITFPKVENGVTITIEAQSPSSTDSKNRGIKPVYNYLGEQKLFESKERQTFSWTVNAGENDKDGDYPVYPVAFDLVGGGIDFYSFCVSAPPRATRAADGENSKPGFRVMSKEQHSKSLRFKKPRIRLNQKRLLENENIE